jgi:1-deoxy-D-xylulose-5-phosphate reductoisomerase
MPTVYNAANEMAVSMFLERKIRYLEIVEVIEACMRRHSVIANPTIDEIVNTEQATYDWIKRGRW